VKEIISKGDEVIQQNKNYDATFNCHNKNFGQKKTLQALSYI